MPPIIVVITLSTALCLAYMARSLVRNPSNHALRAACLSVLALMLAVSCGLAFTGDQLLNPVPALDWWISVGQHALTMTGLYFSMAFFLYSVHPLPAATVAVRRHAVALLAVIAVAVAFAALADPADYTAGFIAQYGHGARFSAVYLVVFALYTMAMIFEVARLSWRWSRLADNRWIRRGMLVGAIGDTVGVVYCAVKAGYIVLLALHVPLALGEQTVTGPLILVAVPLGVVGLTVPGWGPRLSAITRWASMYRAHRQLHPLWSTLTEQFPHVRMSLDRTWLGRRLGAGWDDKWAPHLRDLDLRLHLRVVQIWDARRALLDHYDAASYRYELERAGAKGLTGDKLAAHAEAAMLATALRRRRRDDPVVGGDKAQIPAGPDAADLSANVVWLRRVSRLLRRAG
jgi:hypothetical protein